MAPVLPRRLGKRSLLGARVGPAPARTLPEPSALRDPASPPGQPQVLPTPLDEQLPAFPAPSLPGSGIPERSVSCSIDVPKRSWQAAVEMDEMVAALVLTSLSCSPALRRPPSQGAGDPWKDSGDISDSGSSTTSGHWSSAGSATASPPHCPSSATASPLPCPDAATASPPHCPSSATASPPHCPSSVTMSPPHYPGSVTMSPPHHASSATASLPCYPGSATVSPHHTGSATVSPPHHTGSATVSPPYHTGSATVSPPHHTGSATVSPPHRTGSATVSPPRCPCAATVSPLSDDGFDTDPEPWVPEEPAPRRRKSSARLAFKCLWPGCGKVLRSGVGIKRHVRTRHLGDGSECEEDFYYTELRVPEEPPPELPPPAVPSVPAVPAVPGATAVPSVPAVPGASGAVSCSAPIVIQPGPGQPGLSHSAPGSFWHIQADHAYQALPSIQIPVSPHIFTSISWAAATSPLPSLSPARSRSLSLGDPQPPQPPPLLPPRLLVASPPRASLNTRKIRGEAKKCRKVYGIEHREQWCTACRWKKACQRFLD